MGSKAANERVKGSTTTRSAHVRVSVSRRTSFVMSFFRRSAWNTSSGSMSNVSTTALPPLSRAVSQARSMR